MGSQPSLVCCAMAVDTRLDGFTAGFEDSKDAPSAKRDCAPEEVVEDRNVHISPLLPGGSSDNGHIAFDATVEPGPLLATGDTSTLESADALKASQRHESGAVADAVAAVQAKALAEPSPSNEWEKNISKKELATIYEFQRLMAPTSVDLLQACRFTRVCRTAKDAAKMYRDYLAWYAKENVDQVLSEPALEPKLEAVLQESFTARLLDGLDRVGRPAIYITVGMIDLSELTRRGVTLDVLMRRYVRELERIKEVVSRSSDPLAGYLAILDLNGCTVRKFLGSWRFWLALGNTGDSYYPELVGKTCLVNGPPLAGWAVNKISVFLDKKTVEKLELHGPSNTKEALEKLMAVEEWPIELH